MLYQYGQVVGQLANIVNPNPKCRGCLHYLDAPSACEIGLNPAICGDGSTPVQGYAPIESTGPDPTVTEEPGDSVTESARAGTPRGRDIPLVPISTSHLGDASELLALSQRMIPDLKKAAKEGCSVHGFNDGGMGIGNIHASIIQTHARCHCLPFTVDDCAKAIHDELGARLRNRVSIKQVKAFITKNRLF